MTKSTEEKHWLCADLIDVSMAIHTKFTSFGMVVGSFMPHIFFRRLLRFNTAAYKEVRGKPWTGGSYRT